MEDIKSVVYVTTIAIIAAIEPLALPWILVGSFVVGLLGGAMSAMMQKIPTSTEVATHAMSMALFGCSTSMIGYWYFADKDPFSGYLLIGLSGLCALVGVSIFQPLSKLVTSLIESLSEWILATIKRLIGGGK